MRESWRRWPDRACELARAAEERISDSRLARAAQGRLPRLRAFGRRLRIRDWRWWFLLVYVTAGLILVFQLLAWQQNRADGQTRKFERQIAENCTQSNDDVRSFNRVLDQLSANVRNSRALTPANKAQALRVYGQLRRKTAVCPPPPEN